MVLKWILGGKHNCKILCHRYQAQVVSFCDNLSQSQWVTNILYGCYTPVLHGLHFEFSMLDLQLTLALSQPSAC